MGTRVFELYFELYPGAITLMAAAIGIALFVVNWKAEKPDVRGPAAGAFARHAGQP
jgi:hypothetical protein